MIFRSSTSKTILSGLLITMAFMSHDVRALFINIATGFALKFDDKGRPLSREGTENLNGFKETFVKWNECGDAKATLKAQVTWEYGAIAEKVSWPTKKEKLIPCTEREMSKAFHSFMNRQFGKCIAFAMSPEAQKEIADSVYRLDSKSDPSGVDNVLVASVGRAYDKAKKEIEANFRSFKNIEFLHQGILADDLHSVKSYHSKLTLRAIDISHIRVQMRDGKIFTYQHNVASYVENLELAKSKTKANVEQTQQSRFWRSLGACLVKEGAGVITKTLYHTGSGFKHSGHMHLSLPYTPAGNYFEKGVDNREVFFQ